MKQKLYENSDKKIEIYQERIGTEEKVEYFKNGLLYSSTYPKEPYKLSFSLCPSTFSLLTENKNILMLGTAGGCMAIQLQRLHPSATIVLVDIDPEAEQISKEFFGLNQENVHFYCEDAAVFVTKRERVYDYIVLDIFINDKMPQFVTSNSFWTNLYSILSKDGIVAFNNNMRRLQLFDLQDNPLVLLLQNLYHLGFKSVYHCDVHNGGWSYLFKNTTDRNSIRQRFYKLYLQHESPYIKMAVTSNAIYLNEVGMKEEIPWIEYTDIIDSYRKFVFRGILKITRMKKHAETEDFIENVKELVREEMRLKLGKFQSLSYSNGKTLFRSNHLGYFMRMNQLSNGMEKRCLSSFISEILMPEESIIKAQQWNSYYMQILWMFGSYTFNIVNENYESLLVQVWKNELKSRY